MHLTMDIPHDCTLLLFCSHRQLQTPLGALSSSKDDVFIVNTSPDTAGNQTVTTPCFGEMDKVNIIR